MSRARKQLCVCHRPRLARFSFVTTPRAIPSMPIPLSALAKISRTIFARLWQSNRQNHLDRQTSCPRRARALVRLRFASPATSRLRFAASSVPPHATRLLHAFLVAIPHRRGATSSSAMGKLPPGHPGAKPPRHFSVTTVIPLLMIS